MRNFMWWDLENLTTEAPALISKVRVLAYYFTREQACNFFIKRLWRRCFPVNFAKFLRTPFYRTLLDDCFLFCICLIGKKPLSKISRPQALLHCFEKVPKIHNWTLSKRRSFPRFHLWIAKRECIYLKTWVLAYYCKWTNNYLVGSDDESEFVKCDVSFPKNC